MRTETTRAHIYMDHNATSPLREPARKALGMALSRYIGNPSSPHACGHEARVALEDARAAIAAHLGVDAAEILFVSGGTEANNLAIHGVTALRKKGHLIVSAVDHPSVLEPAARAESQGWKVTRLGVDRQGRVDPDLLRKSIRSDTALISIMAANNETGVLQPLDVIAAVARKAGVPLHVDAAQTAGRLHFAPRELGITLASISSHKMGGPVGVGALYVAKGRELAPLLLGGGQEGKRRPGTEPVALAIAFAAAMGAGGWIETELLRDMMEASIRERVPNLRVNGGEAPRLPNTSSLLMPGVNNESLVIRMDLRGYAISTGAACSTGAARPSHVLAAMGLSAEASRCTVRVSLGPESTQEHVNGFVSALSEARVAVAGRA
jgi:cysteine desulfurase